MRAFWADHGMQTAGGLIPSGGSHIARRQEGNSDSGRSGGTAG
jgi:hypothetical protein